MKHWRVLFATIVGSSIAYIDSTALNIAMPALQADLHATVIELQWIVEIYLLGLSALILVGGAAGDRYGKRRVFAWGVGLVGLASLGCAAAPTAGWLIAARAALGVGAALMVPGSLALLSASFGDDDAGRAKAIGTWSAATALTMALGQVIGGVFVEYLDWRAIFWINVPLGAAVLWALTGVPEPERDEAAKPLDRWGAVLATLGLGGLVFGLIEGPRLGWGSPLVAGTLVGGLAALVGFGLVQARSAAPMVPLALFENRAFSSANVLTVLLYGALNGALFFLPLYMIQVQGYGATATGAALLPFVACMAIFSGWASKLAVKHGPRLPLTVGPAFVALGYALLALSGELGGGYFRTLFPGITVIGFGMALTAAPLTNLVMSAASGALAGAASGVNNAVARVGGLMAIAVFGALAQGLFGAALAQRGTEAALPAPLVQQLVADRARLAEARAPQDASPKLKERAETVVKHAFIDAYRPLMGFAAVLAALSALAALIGLGRKSKPA